MELSIISQPNRNLKRLTWEVFRFPFQIFSASFTLEIYICLHPLLIKTGIKFSQSCGTLRLKYTLKQLSKGN